MGFGPAAEGESNKALSHDRDPKYRAHTTAHAEFLLRDQEPCLVESMGVIESSSSSQTCSCRFVPSFPSVRVESA